MKIQEFFDSVTSTISYIVYDEATLDCIIIDPVLNYSVNASKISRESINLLVKFITDHKLKPLFSFETHAHADHLSSGHELRLLFPDLKLAIGSRITEVQEVFKGLFNLNTVKTDGSQFDLLLKDDEVVNCGSIEVKVLATPGHTPACCSFLIGDFLFCGDALFMPNLGCARCDFPKGSAKDLYISITSKIYTLDDDIKIMTAHDYPGQNQFKFLSTVAEQKENNKMIPARCSLDDFIEKREKRDAQLDVPRLLLPSLQVNIEAGKLPEMDENGKSYLKIPLSF